MGLERHTAALALLALVHACRAATAAETDGKELRIIWVVSVASASAAPDRAEIDLGVLTQAESAKQAASENVKRVDAVLAAVRKTLDTEADLTTVGYVRAVETAGEPPIVRPMMIGAAMARGDAPPTPVEPGTIELHANVTVTFEIAE